MRVQPEVDRDSIRLATAVAPCNRALSVFCHYATAACCHVAVLARCSTIIEMAGAICTAIALQQHFNSGNRYSPMTNFLSHVYSEHRYHISTHLYTLRTGRIDLCISTKGNPDPRVCVAINERETCRCATLQLAPKLRGSVMKSLDTALTPPSRRRRKPSSRKRRGPSQLEVVALEEQKEPQPWKRRKKTKRVDGSAVKPRRRVHSVPSEAQESVSSLPESSWRTIHELLLNAKSLGDMCVAVRWICGRKGWELTA